MCRFALAPFAVGPLAVGPVGRLAPAERFTPPTPEFPVRLAVVVAGLAADLAGTAAGFFFLFWAAWQNEPPRTKVVANNSNPEFLQMRVQFIQFSPFPRIGAVSDGCFFVFVMRSSSQRVNGY